MVPGRYPTRKSISLPVRRKNKPYRQDTHNLFPPPPHSPWFHQGGRHQHDRRRPRVRQHPQRRLSPPEAKRHQPPAVHVGWREPRAHVDAAQKSLPDVKGVVAVVGEQERVVQAVPEVGQRWGCAHGHMRVVCSIGTGGGRQECSVSSCTGGAEEW